MPPIVLILALTLSMEELWISGTFKVITWLFFVWSIIDLQCCVSFRCTTKLFICILFQILFHYRYYKILNVVPCACCLSILYIEVCICSFEPLNLTPHCPLRLRRDLTSSRWRTSWVQGSERGWPQKGVVGVSWNLKFSYSTVFPHAGSDFSLHMGSRFLVFYI